MKLVALIMTGTLGLAACGSDDGGHTIAETPLAGTIGGQPWTFVEGETDDFLSDGDAFWTDFYGAPFTACDFGSPGGNQLIALLPKAVGDYELSSSRNLTFVVHGADGADTDNLVTFDGRIVVDEVTDTMVKGGLHAIYDGDNEVDGTFELTICPDDSL